MNVPTPKGYGELTPLVQAMTETFPANAITREFIIPAVQKHRNRRPMAFGHAPEAHLTPMRIIRPATPTTHEGKNHYRNGRPRA